MVFVYILIGLVVGLGVGILLSHTSLKNKLEKESRTLLKEAEEKAEIIKKEKMLQAKEKFLQLKGEHEKQVQERNNKVMQAENKIKQKEQTLNQKVEELQKKSNEFLQAKESLNKQVEKLQQRQQEVEKTYKESVAKLEQIAGLSAEEAKAQLVETLTEEAKDEAMSKIMDIVEEAKLTANQQAKKIVIESIQRTATENAIENTVSVFNLESEEVKGRIIGREGRNIRTLENLTGVEVIIDDSPDAILLSCFDPVRREIARLSLHKLVTDGRIHPARIEEMVDKARREVDLVIKQEGEQATFETGVHGLHPELIKLLGRLKYRTSYGQNVLRHSIEVAHLAGVMAGELGIDVALAKRAGLLHDIGKGLDHEYEGTHVSIGVEVARKYKESNAVVHAIQAHHNDVEPQTPLAFIVMAADAISAARPGARRENLENYIKRLEKLEEISNSFAGVENSYAVQAGREVRIMVKPEAVNDDQIVILARDIVAKIENELDYPGQIKVNVIRESRAVDNAK